MAAPTVSKARRRIPPIFLPLERGAAERLLVIRADEGAVCWVVITTPLPVHVARLRTQESYGTVGVPLLPRRSDHLVRDCRLYGAPDSCSSREPEERGATGGTSRAGRIVRAEAVALPHAPSATRLPGSLRNTRHALLAHPRLLRRAGPKPGEASPSRCVLAR